MSELIDRQAAIKAIDALPNCYNGFSDTYDKSCIIGVLEELQPSDAVPVVRCKDCKWCGGKYNDYCFRDEYNHAGDWFCADGERREG